MITFPIEDTFPLGNMPQDTSSILEEHWGIDYGITPEQSKCTRCGKTIATNEEAEQHAGECE